MAIGDETDACRILAKFVADEFDAADKPLYLAPNSANEDGASPIATCEEVAALGQTHSFIPANPDAVPPTDRDGLFYAYYTLVVSVPEIDQDAGHARFEIARVCGPLCGSGALVEYRKSLGVWRKKSETTLWIS